jgi:hypothetical protein
MMIDVISAAIRHDAVCCEDFWQQATFPTEPAILRVQARELHVTLALPASALFALSDLF